MRRDVSPAIAAVEAELREAVSRQRAMGDKFLKTLTRRDTYRSDLGRRRPTWCEEDAQYAEYVRQLQARLVEAEGQIKFYEAHLTRGQEIIDDCDRRVAALERQDRLRTELFA